MSAVWGDEVSVCSEAFRALQWMNMDFLNRVTEWDMRPVLPALVRSVVKKGLSDPRLRRRLLLRLTDIAEVDAIKELLTADFAGIYEDLLAEYKLCKKIGSSAVKKNEDESSLLRGVPLFMSISLNFEGGDPSLKFRLILRELVLAIFQVKEKRDLSPPTQFCELFEQEVFADEVGDILSIAMAEFPDLLLPGAVARALLLLFPNPSFFICRLVANAPHTFIPVCTALITMNEKQEDEMPIGRLRGQVLLDLCKMNHWEAMTVRSICVESGRLLGVSIMITMDAEEAGLHQHQQRRPGYHSNMAPPPPPLPGPTVQTFLSGVFLSGKPEVRTWYRQWIKVAQREKLVLPPRPLKLPQAPVEPDPEMDAIQPDLDILEVMMMYPPPPLHVRVPLPVRRVQAKVCEGGDVPREKEARIDKDFQFCVQPSIKSLSWYNQLRLHQAYRLEKLLNSNPGDVLSPEFVVEALDILRFYCILKAMTTYNCKLAEVEMGHLLRLVMKQPVPCSKGGRFISLGLCTLLTCPSLMMPFDKENKGVLHWIRWLAKDFHPEKSSSLAELLLLMAILFHGNRLPAVGDLVSTTLGIKVVAKPACLQRLKTIFTEEVFTEQVVAAHAIKVPATRNLNAKAPGFLPVHCIFQLVKSRVFTKHKVPIKDWVYRQLMNSEAPLHPILPPLLEVYVNSILIPQKDHSEEVNEPFSKEQVLAVFLNDSKASLPTQLLMLYYLMLYEDVRLKNMKAIVEGERDVLKYSNDVLEKVPIKYLLLKAQEERSNFGVLFPPLLRLLVTHYPHLCHADEWLHRMDSWVSSKFKQLPSSHLKDPKHVGALVAEAFADLACCPAKAVFLLKGLAQLSPAQLRPLGEAILKNAVSLLDADGSQRVPRLAQDLFRELWSKMSIIYPRASWVVAANSMTNGDISNGQVALPIQRFYSQDDCTFDPLIILRCDTRIFQCPPLFEIVLRTLRGHLAASRAKFNEHVLAHPWVGQAQPNQKGLKQLLSASPDAEREELKNALVIAHESAAVQILLEIAARNDSLGIGELRTTTEVRSLICSHLHQMFIAEPHLVKLVHFQSYVKELLPITARGIPSMHICLDFLPELVTTPDVDRLVFATCLLSELAYHYALPKALSACRLTLSVISTLLMAMPPAQIRKEFAPIFPALIRLGITFPPLLADIVGIFVQFGQTALAIPGVRPSDRSYRRRSILDGSNVAADVATPESFVIMFEHFMKQCILSLNLT